MATQNDAAKAIAAAPQQTNLTELINRSSKELGRALPAHMNPERLVRIALTCIRINPKLAQCSQESFLGALFTSAQMGIEPVAGLAYLIPFMNNRKQADGSWRKILEAQFVLGYKGLADLFYRHEKAVQLDWGVVHAGDEFEYERGTNAYLKHKPMENAPDGTAFRPEAFKVRGYWVMATLQGGGKPFLYMSAEECLEHGRKHSKTWDKNEKKFYPDSPWATNTEAMCLKTVLIQLAKLLPLSIELQKVLAADETSRDFKRGVQDVMDLPSTTTWEEEKPVAKEPEIEFGEPKK